MGASRKSKKWQNAWNTSWWRVHEQRLTEAYAQQTRSKTAANSRGQQQTKAKQNEAQTEQKHQNIANNGAQTGARIRVQTGKFLRRTDVTPTCVSGTTFSP